MAALTGVTSVAETRRVTNTAADFLLEVLSAYEMVRRAVAEAQQAVSAERRQAAMIRQLSTLLGDASLVAHGHSSIEEMLQLVAEQTCELTHSTWCVAHAQIASAAQRRSLPPPAPKRPRARLRSEEMYAALRRRTYATEPVGVELPLAATDALAVPWPHSTVRRSASWQSVPNGSLSSPTSTGRCSSTSARWRQPHSTGLCIIRVHHHFRELNPRSLSVRPSLSSVMASTRLASVTRIDNRPPANCSTIQQRRGRSSPSCGRRECQAHSIPRRPLLVQPCALSPPAGHRGAGSAGEVCPTRPDPSPLSGISPQRCVSQVPLSITVPTSNCSSPANRGVSSREMKP